MSSTSIPKEVKENVNEIVENFNKAADPDAFYLTRFRGRFLYLDRVRYGRLGPICRLTYTGDINKWEFAIFKDSNERYDPDERLFSGFSLVDGTIEGAMKAGLAAYPS